MLDLILIIFTLTNYFYYAYSVSGVFRSYSSMNQLAYSILKMTSVSTWFVNFYALAINVGKLSVIGIYVCLLFQLFAFILFQTCRRIIRYRGLTIVFSKDQASHLLEVGPYQFVRHPFYLTYLLSYFSISILTLEPLSFFMSFVMLGIYIYAAMFEENKFMQGELKDRYVQYQSRTGMFFPNPYKYWKQYQHKIRQTI